ncbi:MAG: hypothetical protein V4536_02310 [Pseudomonadota bacterium]
MHNSKHAKPASAEEKAIEEAPALHVGLDSLNTDKIDDRRTSALTKREIMEQLSRERFPWEE